ncbi:MAG: HutP family protein, partial [Clostridiales bacterium]
MNGMGRKAVNIVITEESKRQPLIDELRAEGMKICIGKVGSMNLEKIIAAVMTAAKREKLWESDSFREEHAIYDATVEAL